MTIRIGNGAGFWGDDLNAPVLLAQTADLDYLTLEYLAELTMSILARKRQKDPQSGFATDVVDVVRRLAPTLTEGKLRIVTNAGGMNPPAAAATIAKVLCDCGLADLPIGVVTGDDLLARIESLQAAGCPLQNLDTGEPLSALTAPIVSANAYLGAGRIASLLGDGARIIVTGRVADASLTVGPAMHEFGWAWDDWNRLAAASVAGHLIECGAQSTGGLSHDWAQLELAHVGYPIAELEADGACVITKPADTGGTVHRQNVIEQLVYEIGDPAHYLTPDVDCDFTTVEMEQAGPDRVAVRGATGRPATDTYKVSLAYADGFTASGQLLVYGRDCVAKARACAAMVIARVERAGYVIEHKQVECLGAGASVPGLHVAPADLREVMLRITVRDARRETVERFTREIAPLITSGPPGLAGYTSAVTPIRPVFAYWPTLVPKSLVESHGELRTARDWG